MSIHRLIVASAVSFMAAGALVAAPAWSNDADATKAGQCEARLTRAKTHFPQASQDRGEAGTVRVRVVLNKDGQVVSSKVSESSGSRLLDRAAENSVAVDWQFDVSHCIASALSVTQDVKVVYRRVPKTFSAGVNRRGLSQVRQAATSDQCSVVPIDSGVHVISCIHRPTSSGIAASAVATR